MLGSPSSEASVPSGNRTASHTEAVQRLSDPVPVSSYTSPEELPHPGTRSHHSQLLACKPRAVISFYNYPANEKSERLWLKC